MARLLVVFKPGVEVTTPERQDGISSAQSPEHAGLFAAGTDNGFAAGLDHAGADKEVLTAKLGITHPLRIGFKVIGFGTNLLCDFGVGRLDCILSPQRFAPRSHALL